MFLTIWNNIFWSHYYLLALEAQNTKSDNKPDELSGEYHGKC